MAASAHASAPAARRRPDLTFWQIWNMSFGFLGMYAVESLWLLKLCFVGVGVAWASILSMPYALLAGCLEEKRMGVFMGLFNMFIVLPQIAAALTLGPLVRDVFGNHAIYALVLSGCSLLLAAAFVVRVRENPEVEPIPEPSHG